MSALDIGKVALIPKGTYQDSSQYEYLDLVTYEGGMYVCIQACKGIIPTNLLYWKKQFSASGVDIIDNLNSTSTESALSANQGRVLKEMIGNAQGITDDIELYIDGENGNDTTGDGTQNNPYKTITKALSTFGNDLNGHSITLYIAEAEYDEDVSINKHNGFITLHGGGDIQLSDCYIIQSVVEIKSLVPGGTSFQVNNLSIDDASAVYITGNVELQCGDLWVLNNSSLYADTCYVGTILYIAYNSGMTVDTLSGTGHVTVISNSNLYYDELLLTGDIDVDYPSSLLRDNSGGTESIDLTQAEYDALPDSKLTDNKTYYIKDATYLPSDYALESEGWAVGKQDGVDVPSTSPYYHNNAKYFAQQAGGVPSLSSLSDVSLVNPQDGQSLKYDSTNNEWVNSDSVSVVDSLTSTSSTDALSAKQGKVINDSLASEIAKKGQPNGYASLDSGGRIPYSQLPESAMEYKGTWNAATNTPTLTQGVGTNGDMYIVSVGGTRFGETFEVNDRIVYDGTLGVWQHIGGTGVTSVAGKTGAVTLNGGDIGAGTFAGKEVANASAVSTLGDAQVRNIKASTTDLTAGSSALATGDIYIVYE